VPIPVGKICGHFRSRIIDEEAHDVALDVAGELCLAGPAVTVGYWKAPAHRASAFFHDGDGERWYRTGDIVVARSDGTVIHRSRRDRLIKKRGNRIELAEIEACLDTHAAVKEAAIVAVPDDELGMKVHAFVVRHDGSHVTIVALKAHCANALPSYMVPDAFAFRDALPRTSNGKVDFPMLKGFVSQGTESRPDAATPHAEAAHAQPH
jgi:L-proline---[L-prolyl-carrier protein] ligase